MEPAVFHFSHYLRGPQIELPTQEIVNERVPLGTIILTPLAEKAIADLKRDDGLNIYEIVPAALAKTTCDFRSFHSGPFCLPAFAFIVVNLCELV
jgi:hypothetical protein